MTTNDEDFREDLVNILVNGIKLDFMDFADVLEVIEFTDELVEHYMLDKRLGELFFWHDDGVILHDEKGIRSNFGVVISPLSIQFRTETQESIDNLKNAGRILMSTINFVGQKLEIFTKADYEEKSESSEEDTEEIIPQSSNDQEEESESSSDDMWI
jgi:hypothetical protein